MSASVTNAPVCVSPTFTTRTVRCAASAAGISNIERIVVPRIRASDGDEIESDAGRAAIWSDRDPLWRAAECQLIVYNLMKRVHAMAAGVELVAMAGSLLAQALVDTVVPHATVLAGRVRDPLGHPLIAATVLAEERGLSTIVTDSGTFSLRNIPNGKTSFTVMRIGYAPVTFDIEMPPDTTVFVDVHLQPVTTLSETKVTGTALSPKLARTGYYMREKTGLGYFLHPEDLAKIKDLGYASLYLRELPNVFVRKSPGIGYSVLMQATAPGISGQVLCAPTLFIDGTLIKAPVDESLDPGDVYAVEVYTHGAQLPASFNASMADIPCGVVAFWTKAYQK